MAMEIRYANANDVSQILELYKELNPDDKPLELSKAMQIWEEGEKNNNMRYIVAAEANTVVATCNIALVSNLTRSGRPYGIIENVVTSKQYRRHGLGKRIIEKAVEYARSNDCYKVVLLSSSKRSGAHQFYETIGFDGASKKGFELRL